MRQNFKYLLFLGFIILLVITNGNAQSQNKINSDSLRKATLFQAYKNRMQGELNKVDTLKYGRDSVVISFVDKKNQKIETVKLGYLNGQIHDSIITIYNTKGLPEYEETWLNSVVTGGKKGQEYEMRKNRYVFMKYDNLNRLIKYAFFNSGPIERVLLFAYDAKGNRYRDMKSKSRGFWE